MSDAPQFPPERSRVEFEDGVCTMVLVVTEPKQLFDTDVPVPASYAALDADVLDFFTDTVGKYRRQAKAFRIVIKAPADSIAAVEAWLGEDIDTALRRYFRERGDHIAERLRQHFQGACLMLAYGLVFMLACTLVRTYLAPEESHSLMSSFREGLLVIGWVALWKPVEELLFNWWPLDRELKDWRRLGAVDMRIEVY